MQTQLLLSGGGSPLIVVDSAQFDGTNDFQTRGAALTGAADGKTGIFSAWIRIDGNDNLDLDILVQPTTLGGAGSGTLLQRNSSNKFSLGLSTAGTVNIMQLTSVAAYTTSATWLHILASWDCATPGSAAMYINDVSDFTNPTLTNNTIKYTWPDCVVGARGDGTSKVNGCLAEIYFAPNQYLDFSLVSNRRKFISASKKPVYLGSDGSVPTGTAPLVYFHLNHSEAVADFATNRGTGGNFTITGALTTGSTSPSD